MVSVWVHQFLKLTALSFSCLPVNAADHEERVEHGEAVLEGGEDHRHVRHQDQHQDQQHHWGQVRHLVCIGPVREYLS
jgi:hypothetical protein